MLKYLAIAVVILAISNPQPPTKVPDGNSSAQRSTADKRGTQESPLVVETRAVHSNEETAEEAKKNAAQERVNRWNIGLTFAIAICAFLQFCGVVGQIFVYVRQTNIMQGLLQTTRNQDQHLGEQVALMKSQTEILGKSVSAAEASAEVARDQIRAMKNKERPRIWITLEGSLNLNHGTFSIPAVYIVSQTGATDAFVTESVATILVSDTEPDFSSSLGFSQIGIPKRLPPQFEQKVKSIFLHQFTAEEIRRIEVKDTGAYFIALIKYKDLFDPETVHETTVTKHWRITEYKNPLSPGMAEFFAYWETCGPPEANHET